MFLIILSVALICISANYREESPTALRIALIANAVALIADALLKIYHMKEGGKNGKNS